MGLGKRVLAVAVGVLAALSSPLVAPEAAKAQVPTDYTMLAGNFLGDGRDEVLYYAPGATAEALVAFSKDVNGVAVMDVLSSPTANGTYVPLVGDFDGDTFDEILWYAPGTAGDSMWHFNPDGTVRSVAYVINGVYSRPTSGDFTGDGTDDILWYQPGTTRDVMWEFNAGGGYSSTGRTISGTYTPVTGSFGNDGTDDILWYAPGTTPEVMWDHVPGTTSYTQQVYNVQGTYRPFSVDMFGDGRGSEDIFWYAPGRAGDSTWDFLRGTRYVHAETVVGDYLAAAGDFFGDGIEDILWDNHSQSVLWEHTTNARTQWLWRWTSAATAEQATVATVPSTHRGGLAQASGHTASPRG